MKPFDIVPFSLPNCPVGEVRFEEARDIERVEVTFARRMPWEPSLEYLRNTWPGHRCDHSANDDLERPGAFGWKRMDDWFNSTWGQAAVKIQWRTPRTAVFTFQGLLAEISDFPGASAYDVAFRRTLGVRVYAPGADIRKVQVYTCSPGATSSLRVRLDAGRKTPGKAIELRGYNAGISKIAGGSGTAVTGRAVRLLAGRQRFFTLDLTHMAPAHRWCGDDGLV